MSGTFKLNLSPEATKWPIWLLMVGTSCLASAAPRMALSVMLPEIGADLGITLFQIGLIWGANVLTSVFSSIVGGAISDRYGARRSLIVACACTGLFGLARGLAPSFGWLLIFSLLTGPFISLIPLNLHKAGAQIFPQEQLALSNGGVSLGMATGFMLGAISAATWLSPLLGGWRMVLIASGLLTMLFGLVWFLVPKRTGVDRVSAHATQTGLREELGRVSRIRDVRLLCLAGFGYGGCALGLLGYVPLFLREAGWPGFQADLALSAFHFASMIATIPLSLLSDRLRRRQPFLLIGAFSLALSTLMVPLAPGQLVFVAMVTAGLMRDAFMSIMFTRLMESKGIGPAHAGNALGVALVGMQLGGAISPPIGNALAMFGRGRPFQLWAIMGLLAAMLLWRLKDRPHGSHADR